MAAVSTTSTGLKPENRDHVEMAKWIERILPNDEEQPSRWLDIHNFLFPGELPSAQVMTASNPKEWSNERKALIREKHKAITETLKRMNMTMAQLNKISGGEHGTYLKHFFSPTVLTVLAMGKVGKVIADTFSDKSEAVREDLSWRADHWQYKIDNMLKDMFKAPSPSIVVMVPRNNL